MRAMVIAAVAVVGLCGTTPSLAQTAVQRQGPVYGKDQAEADQPNFLVIVRLPEKAGNRFEFDVEEDSEAQFAAYAAGTQLASCLVASRSDEAERALSNAPLSSKERRSLARLTGKGTSCAGVLPGDPAIARGMVAEALYLERHSSPPPLPAIVEETLVDRFAAEEEKRNEHRPLAEVRLSGASDCLVASDLQTADALLRSRPGSEEEVALIDALFVNAPRCAGDRRPAFISLAYLRAYFASALQRASVAPATAGLFLARE
ncbi:hypothetical protein [Sphingomicrobium nitratireducens]|uniref:hypothetical protein n=1 Tax=Sphingomicrobium nitratireducens TaxID=2964666 RepID=UPI002240533B|nr:hypothetical protein [Sphingomicrobium nitratireducens]